MTTTPDWLLERLVAGDLPPAEAVELRKRLAAEPDGAARLAAIDRSNGEILAALPAERIAAEVARRAAGADRIQAARTSRAGRRGPVIAFALAGTALAAALVVVGIDRSGTTPAGSAEELEETRPKGPARILVHRRLGEQVERLADGAQAKAGDVVQLSYDSGGARYG